MQQWSIRELKVRQKCEIHSCQDSCVIHYYPHLLPDVVFVDPQFILDKISEGGVLLVKRRFIQTLRRLFCCKHNNQTTSTGMSAGISPPFWSDGSTTSLSSQSTTNNDKCCCCPIAHSHAEQIAKAALDKTTRQIATTPEPQQVFNRDWIYLIDSGAQIEFLEALPAFLQHASVCLFVTSCLRC